MKYIELINSFNSRNEEEEKMWKFENMTSQGKLPKIDWIVKMIFYNVKDKWYSIKINKQHDKPTLSSYEI